MKSASEYQILVVASPGDTLCGDEIGELRQRFGNVVLFEVPASETAGGVKRLLKAAASLHSVTHRVSESIQSRVTADTDGIIAYGGGVAASAAVRAGHCCGLPVIIRLGRCQLDFEKPFSEAAGVIAGSNAALTRLNALARGATLNGYAASNITPAPAAPASYHEAESRTLTFASEGKPQQCMNLVKAMAVARPGSQIRWICLGPELPECKETMPVNFTIVRAGSLYEAISREPVDWLIMPEETPTFMPPSVLQALAAGVPVIAVDSPFIEEAVTDDCGVLFGPDPQSEEFVKGLFPYVESDYRMNLLRRGALTRWNELFSPESAGSRLVEIVCLCLDRK